MRKQVYLLPLCMSMMLGFFGCNQRNEPSNPSSQGTTTVTNTLSVSPSEVIWAGPNGGS